MMLHIKKMILLGTLLGMGAAVQAASCDYTPDPKGFQLGFTAYGFPDKSYDVKNNTFKDFHLDSSTGKLLNGSIVINTQSVDTSADKRDWSRKKNWPDATIKIRNQNIANGLFKLFSDQGKIQAKVTAIHAKTLDLSVTMNGVSKTVPMKYTVKNGVLEAKGKVELTDFNTAKALQNFAKICSAVWHKGKTWTDVDIAFSVPVKEKGCS